MTVTDIWTVVITGPTRGLGLACVRALAHRPDPPDLLLLGRPGPALDRVADMAATRVRRAPAVPADLASLADVRAAAEAVTSLVSAGDGAPLGAVVANAGVQTTDPTQTTADGYDLTFGVNHLALFLLVQELWPLLGPGSRVVLVGSGTHRGGPFQRAVQVPDPQWQDPDVLARPATGIDPRAARRSYSTSKLATMYYAHELQRRLGPDRGVAVFDPGLMPGTGLARDAHPLVRGTWSSALKALRVLPGVTTPERSGAVLADLAVDPRWAHLRDGAYVELDALSTPAPHATDPAREQLLWEASERLVWLPDPTAAGQTAESR